MRENEKERSYLSLATNIEKKFFRFSINFDDDMIHDLKEEEIRKRSLSLHDCFERRDLQVNIFGKNFSFTIDKLIINCSLRILLYSSFTEQL